MKAYQLQLVDKENAAHSRNANCTLLLCARANTLLIVLRNYVGNLQTLMVCAFELGLVYFESRLKYISVVLILNWTI